MPVKDDSFRKFLEDDMDSQEMLCFLEELANEEPDSSLLNSVTDGNEHLIEAPSYLKDQVMLRIRQPDIQAVRSIRQTSKQIQFITYSLKTAAAVLAALFLLFSVGQIDLSSLSLHTSVISEKEKPSITSQLNQEIQNGSNKIAAFLNQFSNSWIQGGKSE